MAAIDDTQTSSGARALDFAEREATSTSSSTCSASSSAARSRPTTGGASAWCAAPTASARTTCRCCASRFRRASSPARSCARSPTSRRSTRAASATSRRGRTSSSTSCSCTTSKRRCASSRDEGLTTREACGNSVRNITGCPYAGTSDDEIFDVTPYAEALTRYLLRHPLSRRAAAQVQDRVRRAAPRITRSPRSTTSAGARASSGRPARLPRHRRRRHVDHAGDRATCSTSSCRSRRCSNVAEAVVRVFHKYGDYEHKQRNRMKFVIKAARLGGVPRAGSRRSSTAFRREGGAPLHVRPPSSCEPRTAPDWPPAAAPSLQRRGRGRGDAGHRARASCRAR